MLGYGCAQIFPHLAPIVSNSSERALLQRTRLEIANQGIDLKITKQVDRRSQPLQEPMPEGVFSWFTKPYVSHPGRS